MDVEAVLTKLRGPALRVGTTRARTRNNSVTTVQDFFAAFGHDAIGTVGTPTTITSGDLDGILMIAVQALEKRTVEQEKEIAELKARLDVLERRVGGQALTAAQ